MEFFKLHRRRKKQIEHRINKSLKSKLLSLFNRCFSLCNDKFCLKYCTSRSTEREKNEIDQFESSNSKQNAKTQNI